MPNLRRVIFKSLFLFTVFIAFSFPSVASEENIPEIIIATSVARSAFQAKLESKGIGRTTFEKYARDISNYSFGVSETPDVYVVIFILRRNEDGTNSGGAEYWVGKKDMKIIHAVGFK